MFISCISTFNRFKIIDASIQETDKDEHDPKLSKRKKYSQDLSDEEENFALLEEKPQVSIRV